MTAILNRTIVLDNNGGIDDAERSVRGLEDELVQIAVDNPGYRRIEAKIMVRAVPDPDEDEV